VAARMVRASLCRDSSRSSSEITRRFRGRSRESISGRLDSGAPGLRVEEGPRRKKPMANLAIVGSPAQRRLRYPLGASAADDGGASAKISERFNNKTTRRPAAGRWLLLCTPYPQARSRKRSATHVDRRTSPTREAKPARRRQRRIPASRRREAKRTRRSGRRMLNVARARSAIPTSSSIDSELIHRKTATASTRSVVVSTTGSGEPEHDDGAAHVLLRRGKAAPGNSALPKSNHKVPQQSPRRSRRLRPTLR